MGRIHYECNVCGGMYDDPACPTCSRGRGSARRALDVTHTRRPGATMLECEGQTLEVCWRGPDAPPLVDRGPSRKVRTRQEMADALRALGALYADAARITEIGEWPSVDATIPGTRPQPAPTPDARSRDVLPHAVELATTWMHDSAAVGLVTTALAALGMPSSAVVAGLNARAAAGVAKYGRPLQTHNGRDAREDARQELLDALMYLAQAEMEASDDPR